jgi:hypothetical protein
MKFGVSKIYLNLNFIKNNTKKTLKKFDWRENVPRKLFAKMDLPLVDHQFHVGPL